jgi:hypothetical protein
MITSVSEELCASIFKVGIKMKAEAPPSCFRFIFQSTLYSTVNIFIKHGTEVFKVTVTHLSKLGGGVAVNRSAKV